MNSTDDIFGYIIQQEHAYKQPISLNRVWEWNMEEHILTTELYTNGQLLNGKKEFIPVKNIILPILNLQHRTEDIEVKDVQIYVDDADKYHLSFLVKKYHDDVFVIENDLDTFFDDLNISRIDFGAGLAKQLDKPCPEVVPLQSIAFCDQTDLLSGPIGIKHFYSPDQLLGMEKVGWGSTANGATVSVEELITLSRDEKKEDKDARVNKTPGRYIEVYEVHGNLPKRYADPTYTGEAYETRIFICAFYQKKNSPDKQGVILYTKKEPTSPFKITLRDKIYGRALGRGGAEEIFEDQVWTTHAMMQMQEMLKAASKTILKFVGTNPPPRSKIRDLENLEIIDVGAGNDIGQIDTFPRNLALFEKAVVEWDTHAKDMGASQDPIQGKEPASGTPFSSLQAQIQQGLGLHEYRRGQFAKDLEKIYYDWIIPHIEKKICEGTTFISELSADELQYVADCITRTQVEKMKTNYVLTNGGQAPSPDLITQYETQVRDEFRKKGSKHFIEILKGEFKGVALGVKVNIAGKSKDLAGMVDKLTNVFRAIVANPYILQSPPIAKLFNKIIEASGLDPIDLSNLNIPALPARRMTTSIDYKDLATPPNVEQQQLLELSGLQPPQQVTPPAPTP